MRRPMALLGASLTIGCASGITDLPTRSVTPPSSQPRQAVATVATTLGTPARLDCATLHVRLLGNSISATIETNSACSGIVVARVRAVTNLGTLDAAAPLRAYAISLSLRNSTADYDFGRPFAIIADLAHVVDVSGPPAQTFGNGPAATALDAVGTTPSDHPVPGAPFWTLDSELDAERSQPVGLLEAGEESGIRTISIAVRPEIRDFTIPLTFHIESQLYKGFAFAETGDPNLPAVAVNKDGSRMGFFASVPGGPITNVLLITPNGTRIVVWAGANGLPDHALIGTDVVLYDHWTATSVDIAVVHQSGEISVQRGVSRITSLAPATQSLATFQFGSAGADVIAQSLAIRNPFSDAVTGIKFVSDGLLCVADVAGAVGFAATTPLTGPLGIAVGLVFGSEAGYSCGTWLTGSLLDDGSVVVPTGFFGTTLSALSTSLGCVVGALGQCIEGVMQLEGDVFSTAADYYLHALNVQSARDQLHSSNYLEFLYNCIGGTCADPAGGFTVRAGQAFPVSVAVYNSLSGFVTGTVPITCSIAIAPNTGPLGGQLFGYNTTRTQTILLFAFDLTLNLPGTYRLTASATGLAPITTGLITVTP